MEWSYKLKWNKLIALPTEKVEELFSSESEVKNTINLIFDDSVSGYDSSSGSHNTVIIGSQKLAKLLKNTVLRKAKFDC